MRATQLSHRHKSKRLIITNTHRISTPDGIKWDQAPLHKTRHESFKIPELHESKV